MDFISLYIKYKDDLVERVIKGEYKSYIDKEEIRNLKYFFVHEPFIKKSKEMKHDIKQDMFNNDESSKKVNKISDLTEKLITEVKNLIKDLVLEEKECSKYELESLYYKYIDYDSFSEILGNYELFGTK